jgi:hypothetical protein
MTAAWGMSAALTPPAVGQGGYEVTVSAPSYPDLVRRAEQVARQKIAELFRLPGIESVQLTVNGKNAGAITPVLDVQISRSDWKRKPASLRPYSNYYDAAGLLGYTAAPVVASASSGASDGEAKGKEADAKEGEKGKDGEPKVSGPLKLEKSNPTDGEERFAIRKAIELTFAKDLPLKKGEDLGIKLEPGAEGAVTIEKNVVTFTPAQPLAYSRKYTLTVAGSKQFKIPGPITVAFKTEPEFTYQKHIRPMLAGTCTSCHSLRGTARTAPLDSYEGVLAYVSPGQGGQILSYTGFHGQQRTGAFGSTAGLTQLPGGQTAIPGGQGFVTGGSPPGYAPTVPNPNGSGFYNPSFNNPSTGVGATSGFVSRRRGAPVVPTATEPSEPTGDDGTVVAQEGDGGPARYTRGGALNDQQIAVLRTWIIQDQAAEK